MKNYQATSSSLLPKFINNLIEENAKNNKTVVLVTGVFDVLHVEHEKFLKKAKKLADVLIIAIESDFRVKKIKGEDRPLNSQVDRVKNLLKLGLSNNIFILPDKFSNKKNHLELIKTIRPNFLAVSSHTSHLDKKSEIMDMVDGKLVVIHQQNPKFSSTKIIGGKV